MIPRGLYGFLLRSLIYPVGDWYRGIPIGKALELMLETQWWSRERLQELQNEKLRRLISIAYENVPYYKRMMDERGLRPEDIQCANDLVKLPLLTKQVIAENAAAEGLLNRRSCKRKLRLYQTSGTTGWPTSFYQSRTQLAWDRASQLRFLSWCGIDRGEMVASIWGRRVVGSRWSLFLSDLKVRYLSREFGINVAQFSPDSMREFVKTLWRIRPKMLRGYTTPMVEFARFVLQKKLSTPPLLAISTTAELITPSQKKLVEEAFKAPHFDQYGCGECNGISYECDCHQGLHLAMEHCVVEVVDEQGNCLPPGTTGTLAITTLDNEAFPFVRYVCGDEASLLPEPCTCGRGLPLMSHVSGRTMDMIRGINGNRVWGAFFILLIEEAHWVEELGLRGFQFVQTARDRIRLDIASDRPPSQTQLEEVFARARDYLGPMQFEYRQVEQIDYGQSGKRRYTVAEWKPQDDP